MKRIIIPIMIMLFSTGVFAKDYSYKGKFNTNKQIIRLQGNSNNIRITSPLEREIQRYTRSVSNHYEKAPTRIINDAFKKIRFK